MIKYYGEGEKRKKNGAQREGGVSGNGGSLETKASTHVCGVPLPCRSQTRLQTTPRKRTLLRQNIGCSRYQRNQSELPLPSSRKPRPTAAAATAAAEDAAAEGAQNDRTEQEDNQLLTFLCFRFEESRFKEKLLSLSLPLPRDDVTS